MPTETSQNLPKPLKPIQLKAIDMLSTGTKQVVVVERLDVASATLHRWLQQAHFIARQSLARDRQYHQRILIGEFGRCDPIGDAWKHGHPLRSDQ
jgi:hypothetical protein